MKLENAQTVKLSKHLTLRLTPVQKVRVFAFSIESVFSKKTLYMGSIPEINLTGLVHPFSVTNKQPSTNVEVCYSLQTHQMDFQDMYSSRSEKFW